MPTMQQHQLPPDSRIVEQDCRATPSQVWAVLADGFTFAAWVVGASHVRAVEQAWPQPGAHIHHSIGTWPLLLRDVTRVVECIPERRLTLHASFRPLGEADIVLDIEPDGDGSSLRMAEAPTSQAIRRLVPEPVWGALLEVRNRETLRRLVALSERRDRP